jgi:PAS domain S-box-containing protein
MHDISRYQQLFEASPHPYLILQADADFTIVAVNDKYLEVTGTRREAIIAHGLFDIFPDNPNDPACSSVKDLRISLNRVLSGKCPDTMSVQKYDIPLRDGSGNFVLKYWSPINTPVFDSQGDVTYIIHHVEDVTEFIISRERAGREQSTQLTLDKVEVRIERMEAEIMHRTAEVKQANQALKEAMEELSRLNRRLTELDQLKSQFFTNISHELRTPLTLILAPLENCLRQFAHDNRSVNIERREVELMLRNARLLYRHVTDLLDTAKLEAGCVKMYWAQLDLAKTVRGTASHFELLARNRNIKYRVIGPDMLMMTSDSEKLQRILLNLLSNAFKFTPDNGCITVRFCAHEDQVQIDIQDNGPGIPANMREYVFERFAQVESSLRRSYGGAGLGLAIVKDFVSLLDGEVMLKDAPGGGVLFSIIFPFKACVDSTLLDTFTSLDATMLNETINELQPPGPPEVTAVSTATHDLPLVLVVEDNVDMNRFVADALRMHCRVVCAFNGQQGLEQAQAISPDLILSDIMMPVMNGEQMVQELRQRAELAEIPIIMLTAKSDNELCLRLLKMGVQDYLNKPFTVEELLARIEKRVAERQRIKGQLRKNEVHFQATFEQAAVGMAMISLEGRWLRVNCKLCEILGYSHNELMALTVLEITYADDANVDLDYVRQMLRGEITTYSTEKRYIRKDCSVNWISLTVSLIRKPDQTPDYFIAIIADIQVRKETEANLREAQRIANLGHWKWNIDLNSHTWSEELYRIYGRDLEMPAANYQEVQQYFTAGSWSNVAAAVEKCLTLGLAYQCDAEVVRADGSYRWIIARGEVIRDADDRITVLHGTVQDITERKLAEVALQESKQQLKLFIEYAPVALAMFDREMRYLALSQRWRSDYLLGDRDLLGLCHYDVFPSIRENWLDIHRRGLAGEIIRVDEDCFEWIDGRIQWLRWEVRPWYQATGAIGGIMIFTEDITQQKGTEKELQQLNANLEKRIAERTVELNTLNQSLESFVYSISHDLKAPLRSVEGYSRLLEEDYNGRLDDEGRLFISNIRTSVTRMNELINDLLAYSRMERRKLESNILDLNAIVHQVLAERNEDIALHQIEIVTSLSSLTVHGDREGLTLVLRNLLENAIKFSKNSPQPNIELGAHQNGYQITLWIRDNGIGFDMKYNHRIFEIFERLHRIEDYPGTGIGLALVKKAMERMGGRVWAQSVPGEGATFYLELFAAQENPK